jgi:hypothetical protein
VRLSARPRPQPLIRRSSKPRRGSHPPTNAIVSNAGRVRRLFQCMATASGAGPMRAVRVGPHVQRGRQDERSASARRRRAASCIRARRVMRFLRPTGGAWRALMCGRAQGSVVRRRTARHLLPVRPVRCPQSDHSVSPWRTSQIWDRSIMRPLGRVHRGRRRRWASSRRRGTLSRARSGGEPAPPRESARGGPRPRSFPRRACSESIDQVGTRARRVIDRALAAGDDVALLAPATSSGASAPAGSGT